MNGALSSALFLWEGDTSAEKYHDLPPLLQADNFSGKIILIAENDSIMAFASVKNAAITQASRNKIYFYDLDIIKNASESNEIDERDWPRWIRRLFPNHVYCPDFNEGNGADWWRDFWDSFINFIGGITGTASDGGNFTSYPFWTTLTIVLDESAQFIPPAKIANLGITVYEKVKLVKKVYNGLKNAKQMGDDFVIKLYSTLKQQIPSLTELRNRFQWLGLPDGAKLDGVGASSFFEQLKSKFPDQAQVFTNEQSGNPVFNLTTFDQANKGIYAELYRNSSTGWNWTIGVYAGPQNATSFSQLSNTQVFKIRFDF